MTTVALLLIGNELLTGKIQDLNGHYLAKTCFSEGAELVSVTIVPDKLQTIANAVSRLRNTCDLLITSGGVGPTHDDITYASIAAALNVELKPNPHLTGQIKAYFGERTTSAHLKMGILPDGAHLDFSKSKSWPTVSVENIYIFPGVPSIFQHKVQSILHKLKGPQKTLRVLKLKGDEGTIAEHLGLVEERFDVEIGSYPILGEPNINIHVTVESHDTAQLTEARRDLIKRLQPIVSDLFTDQE